MRTKLFESDNGLEPLQRRKRFPVNNTLVAAKHVFEKKINLQLSFAASQKNNKVKSISFGGAPSRANTLIKEFDKEFRNKFELKRSMYNAMTPYLRRALSNMIGNTAFNFGDVLIKYGQEANATKARTEKKTLFATTPERSEYPRIEGSELGFHLNVLF